MKFSEAWLRTFVNPAIKTDELLVQLNRLGLEVDGVSAVAPMFDNVVVAEIKTISQHPDADRLRVCGVDVGQTELLQIVCGAANAAQGMKAPLAMIGANLPNGLNIKKGKLRGVESFGMLCSAVELGLAEVSNGLLALPSDAPVGQDIREYLLLNDNIIEIDVTPNRGDCLSVRGVAREIATLNNLSLQDIAITPFAPTIDDVLKINIEARDACPVYVGRVIRNLKLENVQTPIWITERLRRAGIRNIHPVVDISNYVMLEIGQPMHAFDLQKLHGGIHVRTLKQAISLALLDGQTIEVKSDTLVIADDKGVLALAGIMGGAASAVTENTTDIFLESACFTQDALAGKAREYNLHTDSSQRFERGVDSAIQRLAIERATTLICGLAGGQVGPVIDVNNTNLTRPTIHLRTMRIEKILGMPFPQTQVEQILSGLGMQLQRVADGWQVTPPTFRFDMAREVDLIEELARLHGYDNLPRRMPMLRARVRADAGENRQRRLSHLLIARGFQEVITYSFVDPVLQQPLLPQRINLALRNPISSEMAVMRTSLIPGLLQTLIYNQNRQQKRLQIFEAGLRFELDAHNQLSQTPTLAALRWGSREPESWQAAKPQLDFYDIKGDIEALLAAAGLRDILFEPLMNELLPWQPGSAAYIKCADKVIGVVGALHPANLAALDIEGAVYAFELDIAPLLNQPTVAKAADVSKFPAIRRDLAIIVDHNCDWQAVLASVQKIGISSLRSVLLFDVYAGKGVIPGRKSFAMGLILQEFSRTLTDDEVDAAVAVILAALRADLNAILRE
ncbi:MAG: phenylalanine--tRNA ligase subunit beta [Gammaproteobacteria bacterium]|nr:phenylalanine--tRNA ligase subunit beta [Gammaproteobacteria bacterium]